MRYAAGKQPRDAVSIGRALDGFLAASGLTERLRHAPVYRAWAEAVGVALGRHAHTVRFERGNLYVEVDSAAHLHELSNFAGEQFREIANARLGSELIRRVHFQLKR
jgi:hypothetical protein